MDISIESVKKLREQTNAGVLDCKKALKEVGGDYKRARDLLKQKGVEIAQKKAERKMGEGLIEIYVHPGGRVGSMLEIVCETDFVARNAGFKKLAHELVMQIASMNPSTLEVLLNQDYIRDSQKKIKDLITEAIAKFGENIRIKRFVRYEVGGC